VKIKFYEEIPTLLPMDEADLLREEFLRHGRKQGLPDEFLMKVLEFLLRNQFYPAGERDHIRQELLRLVKEQREMVD
jgi:hypothetical protein